MIYNRIEKILRKIEERKEIYKEKIIYGNANTLEDYKFICGKILSLQEVEKIIKEELGKTVEEKIFFS